ncbi:hypothetical protein DAPK24_003270 [Pichia kluyveri]|uniref:t-SNARE coiled-coil homology domain-containing protein n=1 Tax=Pichia kluyveri TaxID=36015 RepID=A0AAV5QY76_PICKL|nr:hypothetical protein DAPK24_003270 [Pichia kluyveri]
MEALHQSIVRGVDELHVLKEGQLNDDDLMDLYLTLVRYSQDIQYMRKQIYESKRVDPLDVKLHQTERKIRILLLNVEIGMEKLHNDKLRLDSIREREIKSAGIGIDHDSNSIEDIGNGKSKFNDFAAGESIDTLKSRLLSTKHDQLNQVQSTEVQNNYHDSIQQELIDSLPSMVTSLKEQAIQFQEMLKQDAVILKEATQSFETSHGKFDNVNELLSKYHKEGRLGFWFYIRITGLVLASFLFLIIIIRLIPARH